MNIFGRSFGEHLMRLTPALGLVGAVWVLRLVLDATGFPHWLVNPLSVTVAIAASVLLAVLLIHVRWSGGYSDVLFASMLLAAWGHFLIVAAILFSVLTGIENIYTAPEFSGPMSDRLHLRHICGHLTIGIGLNTLLGAAMGCLVLWLLRILVPMRPRS
ncbi:hypothetical protein MYX78_04070 [Acidobacteria bacterium AH-259-G07]|nr:hypothetical protein [Acidobacteria bacterium AH-259-G07]